LHGSDPVAWQEWNAETVARAKREGKLLFVSIGYFSWPLVPCDAAREL